MAGARVETFVFEQGGRLLSQAEHEEYKMASTVAQIFSGCLFGLATIYLIVSNSTRLSFIQRASIEKRLSTCCQLNTIVAAISCFLNFFQLTEVDNWALPGSRQFTVDTARPIEWILTCPLMQLSLVLMGGSRIPEYRRLAMPVSSAVVLGLGATTLFVHDMVWTYTIFAVGCIIHACAMAVNRLQIIEHSKGAEGLFSGDSEFRKATLILMCTWVPFPLWYFLSPEGANIVQGITVVQMGWAGLNIVAKFSMIFYIQRIKDNYCNRLKVRRAVQQEKQNAIMGKSGVDANKSFGFYAPDPFDFENEMDALDSRKVTSAELGGCVIETMNFLGMAENAERLLKLLRQAQIYKMEDLATLSTSDCERLLLPVDLIEALQKRHKVWSLEMVDDAEIGIEQGEKHYKKKEASEKYKDGGESDDMAYGWYPMPMKGKGKGKMALPNMASPDFEDEETRRFITGIVEMVEQRNAERYPERQTRNSEDGFMSSTGEAIRTKEDFDAIMIGSTFEEQLESRMLTKFEKLIGDLGNKVEASAAKVDEMMKNQERSHSLLEAKMEYVFASQSIKHREENRNDLNILLEMFADKLSNTKAPAKDELTGINEKLEELQQMQMSMFGSFGGPLPIEDNMILRQQRQMAAAQQAASMSVGNQQGTRTPNTQNQQAQSNRMEREVEARLQQRLQDMQVGNQGQMGSQGVNQRDTPNFANGTRTPSNGNRTPTQQSNSRPQSSSANMASQSNARREARDEPNVTDDGDAFW